MLSHSKRELTADDFARMKIGSRHAEAKIDVIPAEFEYRKVLEIFVDGLVEHLRSGFGMLLIGDYGTGKTSAGVIILKETVAHGGTALMIRVSDMVSRVIGHEDFDVDETFEERLESVDALLIDDLGMESASEWTRGFVEKVVRSRSDRKKSLFVTSNVNPEGLSRLYGPGLIEVMKGCMMPVVVAGKNWRVGEAAALQKAVMGRRTTDAT